MSKRNWFILMFLAMISWGGSWTSAKIIANYTASEVIVFWRFLATFISMIPVILVFKQLLKIDRKSFVFIFISAVFMVIYNKFFFSGLRTGLAGAGGVLVTTLNPVVTFLFTSLILRQSIRLKEISGLLLGFTGGLILLEIWSFDIGKLLMGGNLFFLAASVTWAMLTISTQKAGKLSSLVFSFYVYGIAAALDLFIALPYGVFNAVSFDMKFWINILYLSIAATTFGTTAYFFASAKLGANKASSFIFLVPTSAMLFSWLILKEQPKTSTLIGGILALSAVYIINRKPKETVAAEVTANETL